ncbi:FGGY-family carbohydrate kinase, partial [Salinispira pacifica]
MHLIGLDVGTTGCKAVVFDESGGELSRAYREYGIDTDDRGKAEQDAEEVWRLACEVLSEAAEWAATASGPLRSAALSVSVQGDAIIAVDAAGKALCPAQLGMDYRPASYARRTAEVFGEFELFERTGMRPHALNSFVKLLWLRDNYGDAYTRADRIVTYADFVNRKLGAGFSIDLTMASRTMAFNLMDRRWDREILDAFDISPALFSDPVESGTSLGRIDRSLAHQLGLPEETILVSGAHDQPAGGVGAGVVGDGTALDSTGTAEVLSVAFPAPALSREMFDGYYPCYLHAVPGQYFTFA